MLTASHDLSQGEVVATGLQSHVSSQPTCRIPPTTLRIEVRPVFRMTGSGRTLIHQGASMADDERFEHSVEVGLILGVAEALRAEFGVGIDAHPGGSGSKAGAVNLSFQVLARSILKPTVPSGEDGNAVLTWVLRRAALIRLAEVGVDGDVSATLVDSEPGLGDAWLAYLALASEVVLGNIMGGSFRAE